MRVAAASQVRVSPVEGTRDLPEDRGLNHKLAADSVVLLKNKFSVLPFVRRFESIALIGPNMKTAAFCGGGAASLSPYYAVSPLQGIVDQLPEGAKVRYEVGAHAYAFVPELKETDVKTPEGRPGLRMRFYDQPPGS